MKRIFAFAVGAGLALGAAFAAQAAPAAAGLSGTSVAASAASNELVTQAQWHGRRGGYHRGGYYRRGYGRPFAYRPYRPYRVYGPGFYRPAYRPIYRPVVRPVYGYGPRCVIRYRAAFDPYYGAWVRRPVRVCR